MNKKDEGFPLVGEEKRARQKLDVRTPKTAAPKKKLTPELLEQIARVQGTKRKIYKTNLSLAELVKELQSINDELRLLKKGQGNRNEIEAKLSEIIDMMNDMDTTAAPMVKATLPQIKGQLKALKSKVDDDLAMEKTVVIVRKAGEPEYCQDCGHAPCACFLHLPKPRLIKTEDGLIKIEFSEEWNRFDRMNFLTAMKYTLAKKKK